MPEPRRLSAGYRLQRLAAKARIGFDLLNSLTRPVTMAPGPAPAVRLREPLAPGPPAPADSAPLRMLSWNVHRGYDLELLARGLADLVAAHRPHLLLLQEVPLYPEAAFWELDEAADTLAPYHLAFAPMHRTGRRSAYYPFTASGQLTASWRTPLTVAAVPLPDVSRPKLGPDHRIARVGLLSDHPLDSGVLRLAHLHLENTTGPRGRLGQLEQALTAATAGAATVRVVAGDLNTMFGPLEKVARRLLRAGFEQAPRRRPFRPDVDWFFARGGAITALRLPTPGSDHRPVLAELHL